MKRLQGSQTDVATAAALLRGGGLVAFPTETVYGLGADATSDEAVARIYAAKNRPRFNPLICHVPDARRGAEMAALCDTALALAERFWPGPLTLIAPARPGGVGALARAGLETVGVRAPDHPLALAMLEAVGRPIAAPSANPSGRISPTTADHVVAGLGDRIGAVIDGGPCSVGMESTIVRVGPDGAATVLRPGGLPVEAIEAALGRSVERAGGPPTKLDAPGQLASHYAPRATLRLEAEAPHAGEAWLGFGSDDQPETPQSRNLSRAGDLTAAAAALFAALHALDAAVGVGGTIAVARIPERGLGVAINDRLRRAAAPRS